MAKTTVVITGDKKVNRMLRKLASKDAKKVIRQASRASLDPLLMSAKSQAPFDSGRLRGAIKKRALPRSRSYIGSRVSVGGGGKGFAGDEFYGGFQEWGWTTPSGRHVQGEQYMLNAARRKKKPVLNIYREELRRRITAFAKAVGK